MSTISDLIDSGNLKLANFLGIKIMEREELIYKNIYQTVEEIPFLKFNKSFDWLIPVVCRLESLGYTVNIADGTCVATGENETEPIAWNVCIDNTPENLREALFNTCLEAIDDYYESPEVGMSETLKFINEWNTSDQDLEE